MSRSAEINKRQALRQEQYEAAKKAQQKRRLSIAGAIVAGVLVFGLVVWLSLREGAPQAGQIIPPNANAERTGIVDNPAVKDASIPLVSVYQDYQCPYCAKYEAVFGPRLEELAKRGLIRLEFNTMTFLDTNLKNTSSTDAGIAAACADTVGAYSAYHKAIYANQPKNEGEGYSEQQLRVDFAGQAGIVGDALTKFQSCYDTRATSDFVKRTDAEAFKAGVTSTPTYMLNGVNVSKQINVNDAFSLDRVLGTLNK